MDKNYTYQTTYAAWLGLPEDLSKLLPRPVQRRKRVLAESVGVAQEGKTAEPRKTGEMAIGETAEVTPYQEQRQKRDR